MKYLGVSNYCSICRKEISMEDKYTLSVQHIIYAERDKDRNPRLNYTQYHHRSTSKLLCHLCPDCYGEYEKIFDNFMKGD